MTNAPAAGEIRAGVAAEDPALRCTDLSHSFGATRAVDGLNLEVAQGEVFGLLGPNGAGKTTAIRAITTLLPVPAGKISVFGLDCARKRMQVRRMLGYVPQQLSADSGLTGRENVELFARVFDVPRRERRARVDEALTAVDLTEAAGRLAGTYSGGMVRRLELAQALVSAPRLLILDEPTIGLDPLARASVWDCIAQVRAGTGMTVLVTTHYMDEADEHCHRIALMHRGRIRAVGAPRELRAALAAELGADPARVSLEDVFRHHADRGSPRPEAEGGLTGADRPDEGGDFRDVRRTRSTAARLR